jgi:hypothetical protein
MLKKKHSSKTRRPTRPGRRGQISPFRLYLTGTTALFILLLPVFFLALGLSLKSLLIASIAGLGVPWFGYLCWNFSKMTGARHAEHWLAGFFVRVFAMSTYVVLISIFWSIALTLGYQCHLDINNGPDDY